MQVVGIIRLWRHLDEWDALVFVIGLAVGAGALIASGVRPEFAAWVGVVTGAGAPAFRRVFQPAAGMVIAYAMLTTGGGPHDQRPPLEDRLVVIAFPIVSGAVAAGLIHLAKRSRRQTT